MSDDDSPLTGDYPGFAVRRGSHQPFMDGSERLTESLTLLSLESPGCHVIRKILIEAPIAPSVVKPIIAGSLGGQF
jgi:hypothetical protein